MTRFFRWYDRFLDLTGILPGLLVGVLALGICAAVFSRQFGFGGIFWMLELVEYGILVVAMVGAGYVLRLGRHVTVDIVTDALPERLARPVDLAARALVVVISAILLYYSVAATVASYEAGTMVFKSFTIEAWVPMTLIPFGMLLVCIEAARRLWLGVKRTEPAPAEDPAEGF